MALKQNSGFDAGDEEGQPVPHGGGDGATSGNDLVHGDGQSTRDWAFGSRPRPQRSRSRENAMKHGAYARTVPVIRAGPLKEDEEEVRAFYEGVVAEFKPGDSTILQAMAWDIASLQWSQVRLRKWEADGYSLSEDQVDVYQPDRNAYFAREREKAADVLERLGDPELASGDLRPALIALIQVTEVDRNLISTVESLRGRNQLLSVLLGFIRDHYRDTERAIQQLDLEAARHRNLDWDRRVWDSFGAARTEAVSEFTRSIQDANTRISRELDRAITRYQLTREALKRLE